MSEETNASNFDSHSEIKKLNFSVTHKPAAKPGVEKISKKFDPYQYFKKECIQSHQSNDKSEEEIEKVNFSFFILILFIFFNFFLKFNLLTIFISY